MEGQIIAGLAGFLVSVGVSGSLVRDIFLAEEGKRKKNWTVLFLFFALFVPLIFLEGKWFALGVGGMVGVLTAALIVPFESKKK